MVKVSRAKLRLAIISACAFTASPFMTAPVHADPGACEQDLTRVDCYSDPYQPSCNICDDDTAPVGDDGGDSSGKEHTCIVYGRLTTDCG